MRSAVAIALGFAAFGVHADCQLNDAQKAIVIERLYEVIERESSENVTYELSQKFLESGKLLDIKLRHNPELEGYAGECWASLMPKSKRPGYSVLDGDGGVYINMETLEPGAVFWFTY